MDKKRAAVLKPMLDAYREQIARDRKDGQTDEQIKANVELAVSLLQRAELPQKDKDWLAEQFRIAALPDETHGGTGTVQ